ncbi:hypothetical protein DMR_15050 [Solidesulfovibrio magneticus RS-1]|uniref:Uncharacterized protein n=1 Tax=Solidesulfovibrio magneticus (strain ATCC 700980 / DSM 13731 / RS-1) TaxID=573370 RepID=C4XNM2_SOLM1|nr:hypothetical protein DMR_15050 [Solidesulfovibrio magneticus RS-1]
MSKIGINLHYLARLVQRNLFKQCVRFLTPLTIDKNIKQMFFTRIHLLTLRNSNEQEIRNDNKKIKNLNVLEIFFYFT